MLGFSRQGWEGGSGPDPRGTQGTQNQGYCSFKIKVVVLQQRFLSLEPFWRPGSCSGRF